MWFSPPDRLRYARQLFGCAFTGSRQRLGTVERLPIAHHAVAVRLLVIIGDRKPPDQRGIRLLADWQLQAVGIELTSPTPKSPTIASFTYTLTFQGFTGPYVTISCP
jgi:hypothetical protein